MRIPFLHLVLHVRLIYAVLATLKSISDCTSFEILCIYIYIIYIVLWFIKIRVITIAFKNHDLSGDLRNMVLVQGNFFTSLPRILSLRCRSLRTNMSLVLRVGTSRAPIRVAPIYVPLKIHTWSSYCFEVTSTSVREISLSVARRQTFKEEFSLAVFYRIVLQA